MSDLLVANVRYLHGADDRPLAGWLRVENGVIVDGGAGDAPAAGGAASFDGGGLLLAPGYVDVHVHGGMGCDTMDADPDALIAMARFYASHGVTGFLATTWTDTRPRIDAALKTIAQCVGRMPGGSTLLGAHLEGPYLNAVRGGAQNLDLIRRADRDEAIPWLEHGVIRLVTVAPEFEENAWFVHECRSRGITVSMGHTDATYDQAVQGIEAGVTHATHTFNAMSPLQHRAPGVVGAAMGDDRVRCELIADNIHIHPGAIRALWKAKSNNIVLISDAIRAAGMPDGDYPVDERTIYVRGGVARLEDGTLAGSTLTLDRGVVNFARATGQSIYAVARSAALPAVRAIGLDKRKGAVRIGWDADFVLLNDDGGVQATIVAGEVVYRA
ncbi:MAG: N-acetylglucosamine-6-phosphate deacetylase [Chloroflexi bacterium]|nr:N-acetylglucosamine-6-phosphate deacetylase [Chloroflexota bacterium]MBV6435203.1 N-acetylglucosamine-6-phosphate deacetylase [Anaerolineae bacterium]MDL1915109.1 N-acetylglucosamine-6-phosphate deacetylase [Anaerolineae bacterium CFX4]OQY82511.1 MAG: N-acetylglucosamine-6-phosphate deacetylase [Anaerolineae bacterium UTCFX5]MCC6564444.1 N-acetylglucosamine-6-phosphate deacetylase [Chloroflexota bacterium]